MTLSATARFKALKHASKALSHDVGGIEASAELVGKSKSVIGRDVCLNDEQFLNLRDAAELERHASEPFVTKAMARLAGGVFVQLPQIELDATGLREQVLAIAEELGDVSEVVRSALKDKEIKPKEAERIVSELSQLIDQAARTRAMVEAMADGKPVRRVA